MSDNPIIYFQITAIFLGNWVQITTIDSVQLSNYLQDHQVSVKTDSEKTHSTARFNIAPTDFIFPSVQRKIQNCTYQCFYSQKFNKNRYKSYCHEATKHLIYNQPTTRNWCSFYLLKDTKPCTLPIRTISCLNVLPLQKLPTSIT